jgi:hypothetical protein
MVAGNRAVAVLTEGAAPELLAPPVNILRLSLHPEGVAPRIVNLAELRCRLLEWLGGQAASTGDPALAALYEELSALPGEPPSRGDCAVSEIAVPLRIRWGDGELSLISTITTFARATDITVAELSIESFFPTDDATAEALRNFAAAQS